MAENNCSTKLVAACIVAGVAVAALYEFVIMPTAQQQMHEELIDFGVGKFHPETGEFQVKVMPGSPKAKEEGLQEDAVDGIFL